MSEKQKYKVMDLRQMVKESVNKKIKIDELNEQIEKLRQELQTLDENQLNEFREDGPATPSVQSTFTPPSYQPQQQMQQQSSDKKESLFDARPGDTVIFNFQDVTIKAKRLYDDYFQVIDNHESAKLESGDIIKVQGNDQLQNGREFWFTIYRKIGKPYKSNPLVGWRIMKN